MNRADRMLAALADGRPKTREEIQSRAGYFLTNNAASELRKRGLTVVHWKEGRTDYYQLTPLSDPGGADNRTAESHGDAWVPSHAGPSSGSESGVTSVGDLAVTSSAPLPRPYPGILRDSAASPLPDAPSFSCADDAPLPLQLTLVSA